MPQYRKKQETVMSKDVNKVRKIILNFLEIRHIHKNHELINIIDETVITYDGTYPSIEIIYESSGDNLWVRTQRHEIIKSIEQYTGLKHNIDFWLGVSSV